MQWLNGWFLLKKHLALKTKGVSFTAVVADILLNSFKFFYLLFAITDIAEFGNSPICKKLIKPE